MERFEAPFTRTLRRISVHWSMSVCTLLPFCSSAQARSLEVGSNRSGDTQVLPFSIMFLHAQVLPFSIVIYNWVPHQRFCA
jgi:hypothetical protein